MFKVAICLTHVTALAKQVTKVTFLCAILGTVIEKGHCEWVGTKTASLYFLIERASGSPVCHGPARLFNSMEFPAT